MPQITLKYAQKPKKSKQFWRAIASFFVRASWPIIPRALFLSKILHINVALTRICNANCIFCIYQFFEKEQRTSMSDKIFALVIENIKRFNIPSVMLSPNVGEPLLAPNFIDKVKAIRNAGVKHIECTTNGTMLHKIGIGKILDEGPDQINISTAGFDEEMYKRVYRSNKYAAMRDNMLELLRENSLRKKPKVINVWLRSDIETQELLNAPEMKIVMDLACEICVMSEVDTWNGKITQSMLPGNLKVQTLIPPITFRPCRELLQIVIHPDGGIHACACRNVEEDPDLYLGNIMDDNILVAYQRLNTVFNKWERGKIPSICHRCCMYTDPAQGILGRISQLLTGR